MKKLARLTILSAAIYTLVLTGSAYATTVGRTKGSFAVSPAGAASYSIPIWSPPGPKGIQPNISLVYSSQAGNGYVGVGWNIAGLSSINRCNLTYAQDAAPAPVSLSTSDGYCLDGQRLRLTGGTYGTAGSTYQTEIANFQNVTAYGTAGNGPAYFIVQTPDGRTLQYGNGGNSQVLASGKTTALAWMLNQVSDPASNTMTITYSTATGTVVPSVISWTPTSHGAGTYAYTMTFGYGTNVLPTAGYVAGTPVTNPNLLGSITIDYSGTQVKEYVLTYTQSGTTGRDTLTQVQECAASTSNCLYPTTISYQAGSVGVSTSATTAISSPLQSTWTSFAARYDLNGDGYTDLLYQVGSTWYVAFGSASGYGSPVSTGITGGSLSTTLLVGDLLGTGTAGILANHSGTWYFYTWNGSSFAGSSTGLAFDTTAAQFALADINGDGLVDLVALYNSPVPGATVTTRLNTSSGGTPAFSTATVTAYTTNTADGTLVSPDSQPGNVKYFDFNGDGRQDLAIGLYTCSFVYHGSCAQFSTIVGVLISQTGGTFAEAPIASYVGSAPVSTEIAFANLNNDACTDFIAFQKNIYISACAGSPAATFTSPNWIVSVMDWNGDGLADLIETDGTSLYVQLSTATGLGTATALSVPYNSHCTYTTVDANGDGLDDLGCMSVTSGTNGFAYYLHNGVGSPPDLLGSITDGFGNSASPTYSSIVRGNYTATTGTYPDIPYLVPMYVANVVTYSDPSNPPSGTYTQTFGYSGSHNNVQGRGWDGFFDYTITDSRTALTEYKGYAVAFPNTGQAAFDSLLSGSQVIYNHNATNTYATLSSTSHQQRYFPYSSNVTFLDYEFGGTENSDKITTTSTNFTYDNYGNATTVARTVTDNDPGSPYSGDAWTTTTTNTPDVSTSPYCLNLFTQTQVAYTASVGSAVTRTKQYTPDLTNCHYTQIVTEPSSGTYKVTEALGYDAFNNVNSDAVTGIGMSGRTTTANWGTTGQFPMSVTDPSSAQMQLGYNYSFGVPSSQTDPNGLITSWAYGDGFGRETQETRSDGTYTALHYYDMTGFGYSFHGLMVEHSTYSTTATWLRDDDSGSDSVDRPAVQVNENFFGGYNQTSVKYDSLGRTASRSAPCAFVSWPTTCTYWTTASYDVLNRPTQVQRPISSTNSTLQTTSYAYAGRTATQTDPNSNQMTAITDVNGWRRSTKDALGYAVSFGYDAAGARTSGTDSLGNTLWAGNYAYGLQPYLTSSTDMDLGAWSYVYDALGEETSWTDAKSQHFSATYDSLSRPLTRTEPDLFSQWTYGTSASSHNIGQLQSDCTGTGSACNSSGYAESYTYDSLGRQSQRTITIPSTGTFTYTSQYDSTTGLLNTLTYPTSTSGYALTLQYGYQHNILQSVTDTSDTPNVAVWTANASNPAGQYTQETLGNGVVTNRTYDAVTHWLGAVTSGVSGGTALQYETFQLDEVGNVTQRQDYNQNLTENFYYDNDYRLASTKLNGTTNFSLTYDAMGDITSRSDILSGASWTYDSTHKHQALNLGGALGYTYDANGNVTSRGGGTIGWSSYNYPTTASVVSAAGSETTTFAYAPDRSRWMEGYSSVNFGNPATTYYIGGLMELVNSGGVNTYRYYVNAGSEPIAVYSRTSSGTNAINYFLSDHQGSIAGITSSSGAMVVPESYTPFGVRRVPTTWVDPAITGTGWTNQVSDADMIASTAVTSQGYTYQTGLGLFMGLNHMNGRVQDAISGRFLSADPYGTSDDNTQSFNRYSYVSNNPLTYIDPTGFDSANTAGCNNNCPMPTAQVYVHAAPYTGLDPYSVISYFDIGSSPSYSGPTVTFPNVGVPSGGSSASGAQPAKPSPTQPKPKIPKPTTCPSGTTASAAGVLYKGGADLIKIGASWALAGEVGVEGGGAISVVGAPEVGGPVAATGAFVTSVGGIVSTLGVATRLLGAGILSVLEGSPKTVISAVGGIATDQLGSDVNQTRNVPTDAPSVLGWIGDALFGEDPCAE